MTITAKYASRCAACGGAIAAGEKIEWAKGSPVRHTSCPSDPTPAAPRKSSAPRQSYPRSRGTWTGCSCGSVQEYSRPSDCATCRFDADDC